MHQSHGRRVLGAFAVAGLLFIPAFSAGAQTPADNTKVNKGDHAKGAPTADQQKENAGDREIPRKSAARSWTTSRCPPTRTT